MGLNRSRLTVVAAMVFIVLDAGSCKSHVSLNKSVTFDVTGADPSIPTSIHHQRFLLPASIALDSSAFLASLAFLASSSVDPRSASMDSLIRGGELVNLPEELPVIVSVSRSAFLPSALPLPPPPPFLCVSFPLHEFIFIPPELVGASVPRLKTTAGLPRAALPALHDSSTNRSWFPPPHVHRQPPTKISKRSITCAAEDPGFMWGPLWTSRINLVQAFNPRIGLHVHHAGSVCSCKILGGLAYQSRIKLHTVHYFSRPRYFDRIRYGSGGSAPTVRVDLRVQSKMVLRFDVWRSEAIFLSRVMLIRNLRLKMFNPPGPRLVRQSRETPTVLSECIKEDPRCLCCSLFSAQRPQ